jgi:sugar phosphate isomerase/epimerase
MAEKRDYKMFEYQGGYNTLDSNKAYSNSFTGYRTNAGSLGITSDPRTANILKDVSAKLSSGAKHVELALVTPEVFDSIPKQHLKEMNELAKLTGVDVSVHGPVMDTAGFDRSGFSEINRQASERRILDVMQRSNEINSNGNVPVIFHSAEGIAGSEWKTLGDAAGKTPREAKKLIVVNKDNGEMRALTEDTAYYPGGEGGEIKKVPHSTKQKLEMANETSWDNSISQLFFNKERADQILEENYPQIQHIYSEIQEKKINPNNLTPTQQKVLGRFQDAKVYIEEIHKNANSLFSQAYEHGDSEQRAKLLEVSKQYREELEIKGKDIVGQSQAVKNLLLNLRDSELAPRMLVPLEEFATDKSSQTFGNAAFQAYKKFKDKAPVIYIENPPSGFGLSTGEDLKNLVVASRQKFVDNAIKEGMSKSSAEKEAEKLIGATWDVGHINMLRKQGFKEADIIEETKKIAPYVKHVHLSDNFGYEHTELPMGMGNVPLKEMMARLGEKGFEGKKIIEAGQWWQHFQTNPLKETLEGLGSPMYSGGSMGGRAPYSNQSLGFYQNYAGGFGRMLPGINYSTFGAGFSQLPSELGGEMGGAQGSRMSGRGME